MQIYDLLDREGRVFAFEIDNLLVRRRAVAEIVRSIPGAQVQRYRAWSDVFCEFVIDGTKFQAWEPFGDNSRYWIGPEQPHFSEQTAIVRAAFAQYSPRLITTPTTVKAALVVGGLFLAFIKNRTGDPVSAMVLLALVVVGTVAWVAALASRRRQGDGSKTGSAANRALHP